MSDIQRYTVYFNQLESGPYNVGPGLPNLTAEVVLHTAHEAIVRELQERHERELGQYGSIEEKAHLQTIDERDKAEDALSQAYYLIKGESPQWSNLFGYDEAINDIDDTQKCLRAEISQLTAKLAELQKQHAREIAEMKALLGDVLETESESDILLSSYYNSQEPERESLIIAVNAVLASRREKAGLL